MYCICISKIVYYLIWAKKSQKILLEPSQNELARSTPKKGQTSLNGSTANFRVSQPELSANKEINVCDLSFIIERKFSPKIDPIKNERLFLWQEPHEKKIRQDSEQEGENFSHKY